MAPTRVLITGATGLLGRAIYHWFSAACPNAKQRWLVKGTGFTRAKKPLIKLDLNDTKQVMALCMQWKPQVCVCVFVWEVVYVYVLVSAYLLIVIVFPSSA